MMRAFYVYLKGAEWGVAVAATHSQEAKRVGYPEVLSYGDGQYTDVRVRFHSEVTVPVEVVTPTVFDTCEAEWLCPIWSYDYVACRGCKRHDAKRREYEDAIIY